MKMKKFVKGEEVEVSTEEEGFEDSWFAATVIGRSKSRNKYLIEYKTLLHQSGTKPLRESVQFSMLRPVPPQETISTTRSFQLDEEVDAYLNDGWWKGVINKIVSEGSRYSVFFPPTKEILEFDQMDLRGHLDWIDGKWVFQNQVLYEETLRTPENYGSFLAPMLTDSSVCTIDMDISQSPCAVRRNLWEDGVTISKNIQANLDQSLPQMVDSHSDPIVPSQKNIKHSAPKSDAESERPLTKVRARQATKALTPMKACNAKETSIESPSAQCLLSCSPTKRKRQKLSNPQCQSNDIEREHAEVISFPKVPREGPLCGTETTLHGARALENHTNVLRKKTGRSSGSGPRSTISSNEVTDIQTDCTALRSVTAEDYQPLSTFLVKPSSRVVNDTGGVVDKQVLNVFERKRKQFRGSSKEASVIGVENEFSSNEVTNIQGEDTLLPSEIAEEQQPLSMFLDKSSSNVVQGIEGMVDKQVMNVLKRKTKQVKGSSKEASVIGCEHQASSEEMPVVPNDTQLLTIIAEERQPLSPCLPKSNSSVMNNCGGVFPDYQHLHNEAINQMDASVESLLLGGSWPFIKKSHLWENFESNQVFKLLPQHPHFRPLEQCDEEFREGKAIGKVFNFINLVERTLKAKPNEARSVFDNRLKFLVDLEKHGFCVQPIRVRLEEILRKKTSHNELGDQLKVAEREFEEGNHKLDQIDMSIIDLNMKLQTLRNEKETVSSTLTEVERKMAEINEQLQGVNLDFDNMVASPLSCNVGYCDTVAEWGR
ncbi:hypothetical protein AQUCO_01700734v1 [Aquilegia coerulea]|uniref:Agenet domain-containing protein n=1 Tax=Aquilegia coerulea TaxID=218851 RepID=A0A2G5DPD2_AQUCA|nr:hypothetical protein AQUCO_01700734v1 [Aquilegia coerulea]